MLKRTKPILISARDSETLQIAKVKFDKKVHRNLEQTSCLTSERNVTQVNMIFTYCTTSCNTSKQISKSKKKVNILLEKVFCRKILFGFSRNLLCNMLMEHRCSELSPPSVRKLME